MAIYLCFQLYKFIVTYVDDLKIYMTTRQQIALVFARTLVVGGSIDEYLIYKGSNSDGMTFKYSVVTGYFRVEYPP